MERAAETIRIMTDEGLTYRRPLRSTRAMRQRLRELAQPSRDDFDWAVIAVLDDLEAIIMEAPRR
jgi:hypothetical protein